MSADEAALSAEQVAHRNRIHAYGLVAGTMAVIAVAAILWFWLARDYPVLRYVFIAGAAPFAWYAGRLPMEAWLAADARCAACGVPYAVSETGREETLVAATPRRRESVVGRSISGPNEGKTLVRKESWTEERYQVVVTRACSECGDVRSTQSVRTIQANRTSDDVYRR